MAAAFNFIGAFAGTAVAKPIGAGLVDVQTTSQIVVASALLGAITRGLRGVRWGVARRILDAWVLTIPAAGFFGAMTWVLLSTIGIG
ncbi:MAG TPA: hypothetical protein VES19_08785 [Candidatus Limnocylindrales bacterium]|nr:hypothetical protein [Candidatus Limnocylindrales bacterium]